MIYIVKTSLGRDLYIRTNPSSNYSLEVYRFLKNVSLVILVPSSRIWKCPRCGNIYSVYSSGIGWCYNCATYIGYDDCKKQLQNKK